MQASLSATEQKRSRAWILHAEFHVAGHPQIADIQTEQIFPEYVRNIIASRASYFNKNLKALALLSISMPTVMSSLCNREVVPVVGILYDSRLVFENTVQAIFRGVDGLSATWAALHFGPGTKFPSLNDHPAFIKFLAESSLGGMDKTLQFRFDYEGISDARQETIRDLEERARAWKFEAVIDAAQHADLINHRGEILSDYFQMQLNRCKEHWVEGIDKWDLISYSLPQNISSLMAKDSITVGGIFQHVSRAVRRSVLQGMLDGIPGITMTWTAMHLGRGCSLASSGEYQAFLAASTKENDGVDLNPHQMIFA
jgi:hypothetical protein